MTVDSEIFSISTLNTIEHGPLTLNIKPHLDPLNRYVVVWCVIQFLSNQTRGRGSNIDPYIFTGQIFPPKTLASSVQNRYHYNPGRTPPPPLTEGFWPP